jgi:hypothetical protein
MGGIEPPTRGLLRSPPASWRLLAAKRSEPGGLPKKWQNYGSNRLFLPDFDG